MDSPGSRSPPPNDYDSSPFAGSGNKRKHEETEISNEVMVKTPHFITKTFQMINDCDPEIVTWTDAGDKFIVKDQERLATDCIPRYFNHNNFSSFTRQLNFYRFRKMFPSAFTKAGDPNANDKHLIFFHEKFHRDHPEWLPEIKRSTKTTRTSAEQEQIMEDLQSQVATLEKRMSMFSSEMNLKMTAMASEFERKLLEVSNRNNKNNETYAPPPPRLPRIPPPAAYPQAPALNRYTTEDFIRSLVNGLDDGDERGRHAMPAPPMRPSVAKASSLSALSAAGGGLAPPPPRALNRLGTLTLDDINRIVTHLEGDGRVAEAQESEPIPGPPNPAAHINSLSAEEVLMTIRQMDSSKTGDNKKKSLTI